MAEIDEKSALIPEPPHSIAQASVDDKGRLKLPAEFVAYLKAVDGMKVFITTVDFRQIRIYPLPVWKRNASLFDNASENAAAAERVERIAKAFGGDAEVDGSGRVLLPAPLREAMGLEKQPVMVDVHKGRLNVVTKKVHDELMQVYRASLAEDVAAMTKIGFK
jgi:division/cell wall cluster transcriptional repressor MraZ